MDARAFRIKDEIKRIKKQPDSIKNRRRIRDLYNELDSIQLRTDYMCLVIDRETDYQKAVKGFTINGIKYKRLLGTAGGIKNSTIVFINEGIYDEISRRIENSRDQFKPIVAAKLEAYKALVCSASIPVSMPKGILVVDDLYTTFKSDVLYLSDESDSLEPIMTHIPDYNVELDASDGCGIMLPSLAERWSKNMRLDYLIPGCCVRYAFTKGMVFTFDFIEFAEQIAGSYLVKDAWGNEVDVRDVELILTTSMVKLWDSYTSCEEYLSISQSNNYSFAVTKACPKALESARDLNYQFIQGYDLTDDEIEELIAPTIADIQSVLSGDWVSTILYLKGIGLNEYNIFKQPDDFAKGLMIDNRLINDPYVQQTIYNMMKNRINEAKTGVLKVHGNFSICSGDPYALCQNIFGLEVTGLLKAGEIYNQYWSESPEVVMFRAPMTHIGSVVKSRPVNTDEVNHWYQYMTTCTIFNAWDTSMQALNGCDFDGDMVMITDNRVLVEKHTSLPALICAQRKAEKSIPTEEDFIRCNIASFGSEIGAITNKATAMFEVQARFPKGSREYETLAYRIKCGQLFQQNSIDKVKGIECKPMPRFWYDKFAVYRMDGDQDFNRSILADKKPYFMCYIYPALMKDYKNFTKQANRNALREFSMTVSEVQALPEDELTERQKEFLYYYNLNLPVGVGPCVVNRICKRFEEEFDGYYKKHRRESDFDYTILKRGIDYSRRKGYKIRELYNSFNKILQDHQIRVSRERADQYESMEQLELKKENFLRECLSVSSNEEELCEMVIDVCYNTTKSKKFAWSICGPQIINNLLHNNQGIIQFPTQSAEGEYMHDDLRFEIKVLMIGGELNDYLGKIEVCGEDAE